MAQRLHRGQYKYCLSGHRPHFNYISLRVDHRVKHNRAGDFGLSGQDRVDRLGRGDESRCLHFSTGTNWTLRRHTDWTRSWRGSPGKDSADHATRHSSRNATGNDFAWDDGSGQIVSVRFFAKTSDLTRYDPWRYQLPRHRQHSGFWRDRPGRNEWRRWSWRGRRRREKSLIQLMYIERFAEVKWNQEQNRQKKDLHRCRNNKITNAARWSSRTILQHRLREQNLRRCKTSLLRLRDKCRCP